jgi:anthranilate phosphoribosyltransferase
VFDRFTKDARMAMSAARKAAERYYHDYIGAEHVLIGILTEGSGESAGMFVKLGIDRMGLLENIERRIQAAEKQSIPTQLPFTPRAKKVLEYSIHEARELQHNYVGVEHLLLGLLREVDSPVTEAFANSNIAYADVREKIKAFLGRDENEKITTPSTTAFYNVSATLETLLAGRSLTTQSATELMQAILAGHVGGPSVAAIAVALRAKGETIDELAAFVKVMRASSVHVAAPPETIDTCGTGGDGSGTFNISTAAALIAAGIGIPIAKHGGRSASSLSGSADVLKALGVNIEVNADCVARCIKNAGIGFLFAPAHHPGMKAVAPVRRELGIKTFFNLLGPLSNPADASRQLIGVYDPGLCEKFAQVLHMLGTRSAMIVCGAGPGGNGHLDEVSTFGPTTMAHLNDGRIELTRFDAAELGIPLAQPAALAAATAAESAEIISAILDGKKGDPRNIAALNAAAAAIVAGKTGAWPEAYALAQKSIDSGAAKRALEALIKETK